MPREDPVTTFVGAFACILGETVPSCPNCIPSPPEGIGTPDTGLSVGEGCVEYNDGALLESGDRGGIRGDSGTIKFMSTATSPAFGLVRPFESVTPLGFPTSIVKVEFTSDLEEPAREPAVLCPKGILAAEGTKVLVDLLAVFGVEGLDCATPPVNPLSNALIPNRSPSSSSLWLRAIWSDFPSSLAALAWASYCKC